MEKGNRFQCPHDPKEYGKGLPLGMYHCPICGVMVVAGVPHPEVVRYSNGEINYYFEEEELDEY